MSALRLLDAISALGQFVPQEKITYFEASPSRNGEALRRWQELNDAGKLVRRVLQHRKDSEAETQLEAELSPPAREPP
jgi:hypothetical protein